LDLVFRGLLDIDYDQLFEYLHEVVWLMFTSTNFKKEYSSIEKDDVERAIITKI